MVPARSSVAIRQTQDHVLKTQFLLHALLTPLVIWHLGLLLLFLHNKYLTLNSGIFSVCAHLCLQLYPVSL